MAGVRGKQRPPSRAARADPEASARRSKRQREEARAAKPPVPVLSTPTLAVEAMDQTLARNLRNLNRNRKVVVPVVEKPRPPPVYSIREEIAYDTSSQTPACPQGTVEPALEHYNRLHEDEHELVKAVDSNTFYFNGVWMHVNFLARLKGGTTCVELVPKYFFAELRSDPNHEGFLCVSCVKMDPDDPETAPVRGCGICPSRIFHPAAGGHRGLHTPHRSDGEIKKGKPTPQTAKSLFDSWIRKIQE